MGRKKRNGKHSPQKNNLIQGSDLNEENRSPVPDHNKTKINDTKEPSDAHKNTLKEEILQVITENFIEKILDVVNQNVQDVFKKFQDTKNKNYEKTQKQINELRGVLNKHQSEKENTIHREINELKMTIENIKEVVTHDMENFRKKNQMKHKIQWKTTPAD
jgi:phosphoglycerate-specific signal transduction histidine kinase